MQRALKALLFIGLASVVFGAFERPLYAGCGDGCGDPSECGGTCPVCPDETGTCDPCTSLTTQAQCQSAVTGAASFCFWNGGTGECEDMASVPETSTNSRMFLLLAGILLFLYAARRRALNGVI